LRHCSHRDPEGVIHEKAFGSFAIDDVMRRVFIWLRVCTGSRVVWFRRMVHLCASSKRRQDLSESLRQLPRRQTARWYAPALVGKQFWLTYGGKKISTLWSDVHTQMPMSAPGSVSAKNSIDIMAFLLQKNGVPAGSTPLNDTADLSKALPSK
jgi:hypothetical protein